MDHLSSEQMSRWRSRTMDAQELLAASAHLSACESCREALRGTRTLDDGVEQIRRILRTPEAIDEPRRRSAPRRWAIAAALAAMAIAATSWVAYQSAFDLAGSAVAELNDAHGRVVLHADGTVGGAPAAAADAIAQWLRGPARLALPDAMHSLARPDGRLRGAGAGNDADEPVKVIGPVATVLIETRPLFQWRAPAGADVSVQVFDSALNRIATSAPIRTGQWQSPNPLPRGEVLTWQVTTTIAGELRKFPAPPTPLAVFRIVSAAEAAAIDAARATGSHLMLAMALWDSGCVALAAAEFDQLHALNPTSELAEGWARDARRIAIAATEPAQ